MPIMGIQYFQSHELKCKCGCGFMQVQPRFLKRLDDAREKAGFPFLVESFCRCPEHNKAVGGVDGSEHLDGNGVDIVCNRSYVRFKIIQAALSSGIRRIGIGDNFIHLGDLLESKPFPAIWTYYPREV